MHANIFNTIHGLRCVLNCIYASVCSQYYVKPYLFQYIARNRITHLDHCKLRSRPLMVRHTPVSNDIYSMSFCCERWHYLPVRRSSQDLAVAPVLPHHLQSRCGPFFGTTLNGLSMHWEGGTCIGSDRNCCSWSVGTSHVRTGS